MKRRRITYTVLIEYPNPRKNVQVFRIWRAGFSLADARTLVAAFKKSGIQAWWQGKVNG